MASRRAITKAQGVHHRSGSRTVKSEILDAGCAVTRIQSVLCPQGAEGGVDAPGGEAQDPRW